MSEPDRVEPMYPSVPDSVLPRLTTDELLAELAEGRREVEQHPLTVAELMHLLRGNE